METEVLNQKQILFEEDVELTGITEYGYSWTDFNSGVPVPPQGARFDISFQGILSGEKVKGKIAGVDYLEVRADGKLLLNLQATLNTADGETIKITETGVNNNGELRLNMQFHTGGLKYAWMNQVQVWGIGTVNFNTGRVQIKGYSI